MADPFKPLKGFYEKPLNKSKGILDDHAVRKSVNTREGSVTKTPTEDIDIANKKYVDDTHVPAGSEGEIQFNESSAFQADSTLFWDNVNKRLGIWAGVPESPLHVIDSRTGGGNFAATFETSTNQPVVHIKSTHAGASTYILLNLEGDNESDKAFGTVVGAEPFGRFLFDMKGTMSWGAGAGGRDTNLYRDAANYLKTDDSFLVGTDVGIGVSSIPYNRLHVQARTDGDGVTIQRESTTPNVYCDLGFLMTTTDSAAPSSYIRVYRRTGYTDNDMVIHLGGNDIMYLDDNGNVNTAKTMQTAIGGFAIKLTNKTGGNTVVGQLVIADNKVDGSGGLDDAFITATGSDANVIAIVFEGGVADGSEAWVVVSGIADVLMDGGGSARGDRIISSGAAGSADVWNVGGAVATHSLEIGHCIEDRTGAGLARCVLHFN